MKQLRSYTVTALAFVLLACGGDSIEQHRAAGIEKYDEGNYREARQEFVAGLAIDPSDLDLAIRAGRAYQKDYMYDSAMYYFKRADILSPRNREVNQEIHQLAVQLADYANAINAIEVLAETGDGYEMYFEELADLCEKNDEPGKAFYWARKATVRGTDDANMYLMAISRAADYDSTEVAMMLLDSAIAKFPEDPRFPGTKGLILFYDGKMTMAESVLRPLAESALPGMENIRFTLARVLAAQDSKAKKREALEIYQELQPMLHPATGVDSLIQVLQEELKN